MNKKETFDFLMGVLVLLASGIFVSMVYTVSESNMPEQGYYTLLAEFRSSDGISTGSSVQVSGVQVGRVQKKVLNASGNYTALVYMLVDENVRLPIDTVAAVSTDGVFGDSYIDLKPGIDDKLFQDNEEIIYTRDSISVSDMLSKFSKFVK